MHTRTKTADPTALLAAFFINCYEWAIITYVMHGLFYFCNRLRPQGAHLYNAPNFKRLSCWQDSQRIRH